MAQHRRASSSGQDSAVFLHLQQKKHNFHDLQVRILDREERCKGSDSFKGGAFLFEWGGGGGGLRHHRSRAYDAVLETVPRRCKKSLECSVRRVGGAPS